MWLRRSSRACQPASQPASHAVHLSHAQPLSLNCSSSHHHPNQWGSREESIYSYLGTDTCISQHPTWCPPWFLSAQQNDWPRLAPRELSFAFCSALSLLLMASSCCSAMKILACLRTQPGLAAARWWGSRDCTATRFFFLK
ncbi:hypothetical protein LX32DRAFT_234985 [Colletotrichum zoysiae]|uniref:Uncharacterized protein n=1 Tax=Colletotrichum zoysiae TaxID=1216348 RepID=A0AAD9H3X3_9PEZI|nr:hypothetical protein LX32DRAFT_234985 [Colletotrichum zoysiae]